MENSERDGNTRPPNLPLEKSVCRPGYSLVDWFFLVSMNSLLTSNVNILQDLSLTLFLLHTVTGFSVVNGTDVSLEFPCFLYDPMNVGNLISGSSAFSKPSLYI